jgi:uncharacterized protein
MNVKELIAIDVHTHDVVSCPQPRRVAWQPYNDAANEYFILGKRPIIRETDALYRKRKIGLVMFTADGEPQIGARRIANR